MTEMRTHRAFWRFWPWVVLVLSATPTLWYVFYFSVEVDPELPAVVRPTFSRRPPQAYRVAEPGDTLDRVAVYVSAAAMVLAAWGCVSRRANDGDLGLWPAALVLALAGFLYAATPAPSRDGWHGLGWRALFEPTAARGLRLAIGLVALGMCLIVIWNVMHDGGSTLRRLVRAHGVPALLVAALVFSILRQLEIPNVEPAGFWPRWSLIWGTLAYALALVRMAPPVPKGWRSIVLSLAAVGVWVGLCFAGRGLIWYHQPIERLMAVVPKRIFLSAMPTHGGLEIAYRRHHFKTIINLFPEDTELRSPHLPDELRFVREHNIHYLRSPSSARESDAFLDETLRLARDPDAWPILIHCHGCMDRSPAWMGIYRFVVQGRPLAEIMREIERHRGCRPKASVTLLFNRVLPPRAPQHYISDPTAPLLRKCAEKTPDPFLDLVRAEQAGAPPSLSQGTLLRPAR